MSANVETMFYVRTAPWHGLGNKSIRSSDFKCCSFPCRTGLERDPEAASYSGRDPGSWIQSQFKRNRQPDPGCRDRPV